MAGKKYIGELRKRSRQVSRPLLRKEGVISAGYQQFVRIVTESSADIWLQFNLTRGMTSR